MLAGAAGGSEHAHPNTGDLSLLAWHWHGPHSCTDSPSAEPWREEIKVVFSLSLSCCKHQPVLSLSIQTCIMTTFLPRQRHIRDAGRWKQRRPSFPAARRLPPHLSSLFSHSIIFMRMHACPSPRSNLLAPPVCCCIVCVACTTIVCAISLPSCNLPMCYSGPLFSCPELQINHCPFDELLSKKNKT